MNEKIGGDDQSDFLIRCEHSSILASRSNNDSMNHSCYPNPTMTLAVVGNNT